MGELDFIDAEGRSWWCCYWKPVNVTKKQWIHPQDLNDELRIDAWNRPDSATTKLIGERWSKDDAVFAVSDYGGCQPLTAQSDVPESDVPTYDDLNDGDWERISLGVVWK